MPDVPSLYRDVDRLLQSYRIPESVCKGKSKGRRQTFGVVAHIFKHYKPPAQSSMNRKYPELYSALRRLGDQIVPFAYDAITVNQNNVMPPHKDTGNLGSSILVTGGDYTGGYFVLEGSPVETKYTPVCFNGDTHLHWNEPFEGRRWSIIYFKIQVPSKFLPLYPHDVLDPNREWSLIDTQIPSHVHPDGTEDI
jgi:hypothetical protein